MEMKSSGKWVEVEKRKQLKEQDAKGKPNFLEKRIKGII